MSRSILLSALAALLVLTAVPVSADDPSVSGTASATGSTVNVNGVATFVDNTGPFDVGGTKTAFANSDVATALGIDIQSAEVDVQQDGVEFVWHVADLQEVPPEGIRYTWTFTAGGQQYQLQAKRTNMASVTTTEDPVGHAQQLASQGDWFQLRGACQTSYQGTPMSGCYHLTFLEGSFDAANDTVTMFMPYEVKDSIGRVVAPTFTRGAEIVPALSAGSSITATVQAVASTSSTESYINGWDAFYAGPSVQAFVGKAGDVGPDFFETWTTLDLAEDGTFSGSIPDRLPGEDTVHLRACNLTTCATATVPIS